MFEDPPARPSSSDPMVPLRVAGWYGLAGGLWILGSDRLLALLVRDPATQLAVQSFKGVFFVLASAVLIWWLIRREVHHLARAESRSVAVDHQDLVGTYVIQDGRIVEANERLAKIFGADRDALIGRPVAELVAPGDLERVQAAVADRMSGVRDRAEYSFRALRADGSEVWVHVCGCRLEWDGRPAVGGVLLDISYRTRLESQVRQKGRLEALGSLTGSVVHDFNNYLVGIQGSLELLLAQPPSDRDELLDGLRVAHDSARRAAALAAKLRSYTRSRDFHHEPLMPADYFESARGFLENLCGGARHRAIAVEPGLPPVRIDRSALDQVLINLLINAREATGRNGHITLRAYRVPGTPQVAIEVVDDGPGIPQEILERVVEPLFTTKEGGTGLGLATVNGIAAECGGRLEIDSKAGTGTTVRLVLPSVTPSEATGTTPPVAAVAPPETAQGPRDTGGRTARVLVVDDDPGVRRVVVAGLTRMGHQATAVEDAEAALAAMRTDGRTLDLLVCDVTLPDRSGPALVAALEPPYDEVAVLFTSGHSEADMEEFRDVLAAHRFLQKPFSLEELADAVAEALTGSRDGRDAGG